MHSFGTRVFERQDTTMRQAGRKLRAVTAVMLTLAAGVPSGFAQQTAPTVTDKAASNLPAAPMPVLTEPLNLRQAERDFSKPYGRFLGNPINMYRPTSIAKANFANSVRLADMVKEGKIYLSLSDALALALENNYDIAIARYNLDIADTDVLRTKSGAAVRGVNSGLVTNTLGGSSTALVAGGGPGGTTGGSGGVASGVAGQVLSTSGTGPLPQNEDPSLTAAIKFDRARQVATSFFTGGSSSNNTYDFIYNQGFATGTAFEFDFNNSYATTTNSVSTFSPQLGSNFKATLTQHLLQGAGIFINKRFMYEAVNNRQITDSSFRLQILYTVNQVENIYWGLVSAYEAVQAQERALQQSTKLLEDDKKQLQIGTMAPLDVVNAESQVASDKQALISAQSTLNWQQQVIKQAIARNLNDPVLEAAPVIPTDRVSLDELPEENQPVDELVKEAFKQRPELEQAVLNLKNDEITLKGARNGLLPTFDIYGFLAGSGVAGSINPNLNCGFYGGTCPTGSSGYVDALHSSFNGSSPDKGIGFNLTIPLRNRTAQADQARSLLEYRQAELRLEQLYAQIRMQVVNAKYGLTNDRAQVKAAIAAEDFAKQSLDAEVKKLRLGASTTANVLQQERNLATAENNLISAKGAYAKDRAGLYQTLASTLQHYGINLEEAATGTMTAAPLIPGLQPAEKGNEPSTVPPVGH